MCEKDSHLILPDLFLLCRIHPRPTMSGEVFCGKMDKFGEHYGIYLIVSGLAIVLLVIHVFKREQYQNLMPILAGDVIIILAFVMAGIIGYKQKS